MSTWIKWHVVFLYNLLQWITIVVETVMIPMEIIVVYLMMIVLVMMVLPSRASNLCEAAQKCGGAGRGECEVPLRRARRPRSHCALEERWLRPAQGQVTLNSWRVNCRCITLLPWLLVFCLFSQIWNPRRPHLEYPSGDVCGWGLIHLCGGKHGRQVRSIRHAHRSRSAYSAICTWYVIAAILSLLFFKDSLVKTAHLSLNEEEIPSCSVTIYPDSNVHLAFYPDLLFRIVPEAAVLSRQNR